MPIIRMFALLVALGASLTLVGTDFAEARVGRGGSIGSRGTRTYTPPAATNTAPKAAPVERSMTPRTATPSQSLPSAQASRFGGMRGLLMGGLFALALGSIFGFGTLASVLGFLLQFALIAGLVFLAVSFFRRRSEAALAHGPSGSARGPSDSRPVASSFSRASSSTRSASAPSADYKVAPSDLDTFERLLGETQTAFSREDTETLGRITTPEMFSQFSHELTDNARNGVRNEIAQVKLLQGDVSEAWREDGSTYATVAMRFSLIDAMIDRKTNQVVDGDLSRANEAVEFWTFRKDDRAPQQWQLSAIQQAA